MQLKEIMSPDVERIQKDLTIKDAAQKMKSLDVGMIPVYNGDRLVGMITDCDITVRAVAAGYDPNTTPINAVMTPEVVYCYEDQTIEEAAKVMEAQQIRRLIILNRDQRLVGIVSLGDLATHSGSKEAASEALGAISQAAA
ncbi:MAG: CBS domain-containing protein [Candidatus Binatia bacterium]